MFRYSSELLDLDWFSLENRISTHTWNHNHKENGVRTSVDIHEHKNLAFLDIISCTFSGYS